MPRKVKATYPKARNDGGKKLAGFSRQKRDCVVRGFAIAFQLHYETAFTIIKQCGRRDNYGTRRDVFKLAVSPLNMLPLMPHRTTLKKFVSEKTEGTWIIFVHHHMTVCIDGIIHDSYISSDRKIVQEAYEVTDRERSLLRSILLHGIIPLSYECKCGRNFTIPLR